MEAVWFVLGFAVTTTVVLATEKVLEKSKHSKRRHTKCLDL